MVLHGSSQDQPYIAPHHVDPIGFGKVAVVTGCASGIGLACTQVLLAHQYEVFGLDIVDFKYDLVQKDHQGRFHFHKGDLTAEGACDESIRVCTQSFSPRIDLLVNVAGVMDNFSSADGVTDDVWDKVIAVNLTVPVKMMRAVLPFMKEKKDGCIINVASTAALSGAVAGIAYTSSKHGLIGATKNVAWRFRNDGIRCNAVLPGSIDTSIGQVLSTGKNENVDEEAYAHLQPVHALQTKDPEDMPSITALEVAKTIVFLASDQAKTINGVSLPVDKAWGVM